MVPEVEKVQVVPEVEKVQVVPEIESQRVMELEAALESSQRGEAIAKEREAEVV